MASSGRGLGPSEGFLASHRLEHLTSQQDTATSKCGVSR